MKIGICLGYKSYAQIKQAVEFGYDYVEVGLNSMQNATADDIAAFVNALKENNTTCPAVNSFFPGTIRLTGDEADFNAANEYMDMIFEKTAPIGIEQVVFGSGGARKIPEGFSHEKATEQLIKFCADYVAPMAKKYGKTVCLEELNTKECNIINTCAEAMNIVRAVNKPEITLLWDYYHTGLENESVESIAEYKGYITHAHIASPSNARAFPKPGDGDDYASFFNALRKAEYKNERVSIEASEKDGFINSSAAALALLKSL